MRNRLQKKHSPSHPSSNFSIHQDNNRELVTSECDPALLAPNDSPRPSLIPASRGAMNSRSMNNGVKPRRDGKPLHAAPTAPNPGSPSGSPGVARRGSTIRAVPSVDDRNRSSSDDEASSDSSPYAAKTGSPAPSSSDSNLSAVSSLPQAQENGVASPGVRLKLGPLEPSSGVHPPGASPRAVGVRSSLEAPIEVPVRESSLGVISERSVAGGGLGGPVVSARAGALSSDSRSPGRGHQDDGPGGNSASAVDSQLTNGWDAAVGKAGLGKTGRVINRLVSDNEALKRELKIERLKAEDSRQAARLLEDKMERLVSDYESRLLEANVTKTLLSRKERQVESLQAAVELEKKRTMDAQSRERIWREELEKVKSETKRQVEDATNHAALMEGRYNAISSHWRDQGEEVRKAMARMGKEVQALLVERRNDDDKITVLRDLCDQQDSNIKDLREQKDEISRKFQEYKDEQENALQDIKLKAAEREAQQARTLEEAREVLDKLKWALNVKQSIEWAA